MHEDQMAGASAGGDEADGATAAEAYQLTGAFAGVADQIPGETLKALQDGARAEGLDATGWSELLASTFGDVGAEMLALERAFGAELKPTLRAVNSFAGQLAAHHESAIGRLVTTAAGVRLLNDLRLHGAGAIDVHEHADALRQAGETFRHALEQAKRGVAMPGIAAAAPRSDGEERRTVGGRTELELRQAMADERYWSGRDQAYRAEITRGWEELYADQRVQTAAIAPTGSR